MAVDTAAKRRSAVGARRLPWFRRFLPAPDGTVSQGDRQSIALVYSGILAGTPVSPSRIVVMAFSPQSKAIRFVPSTRTIRFSVE